VDALVSDQAGFAPGSTTWKLVQFGKFKRAIEAKHLSKNMGFAFVIYPRLAPWNWLLEFLDLKVYSIISFHDCITLSISIKFAASRLASSCERLEAIWTSPYADCG
jgi:hypothetical protein